MLDVPEKVVSSSFRSLMGMILVSSASAVSLYWHRVPDGVKSLGHISISQTYFLTYYA